VIVTVTLNAALDVAYEAEDPSWQTARDITRVRHRAGGSGVAVARVLYRFGHEVLVAGLAGGATGELIKEDLGRSGIPVALTGISQESRRVLAVTDTVSGRTMRLREPGPYVTTEELGRFAGDYRRTLADATAVVLCGTLPLGMPPEIYGSLATYAAEAGVPVILNTGGEALRHAAARRPDLVVPDEEGEQPGAGRAEADGDALLAQGAAAVAVPAGDRITVVTKAGRWSAALPGITPGPPGPLVGGLVPGLLLGWSWPDLLRHAVAVAAAADSSGDVNLTEYERLVDQVAVEPASLARRLDRRARRVPPDDQVRAVAGRGHQPRVRLVQPVHPLGGVPGGLAELDVPPDQPADPDRVVDLHEPGLVQQRPDQVPRRIVQQQVITLGDDQGHGRADGDAAGDRLLDRALERGGVDDLARRWRTQPPQQRQVPVTVERVRRSLPVPPSQPGQFHVGQVQAVHGHLHRGAAQPRGDQRGQRALPGPGGAGDTQDPPGARRGQGPRPADQFVDTHGAPAPSS
jgi:tagatose 6-phosphate kinase